MSEQENARALQAETELRGRRGRRGRRASGELAPEQRQAAEDRPLRSKADRTEAAPLDVANAIDARVRLSTAAALDAPNAASTEVGSNDVVLEIPVATGEEPSGLEEATRPAGRRWTCLQEASSATSGRLKFWDGCGMETHAIVGRRVDVEGLGTGKCTDTRQTRLGGGFLHRILLDSGMTKEVRLLHGGPDGAGASGDVGFSVEDEQPVDQPWRWSDDPRSPPPQPGEVGNLTHAQTAAAESFRQLAEADGAEETVVLRYLRANNFDVARANDQWAATLAWREVENVDAMMQTQRPPKVCETPLLLQGLYPHMMAGYDRGGRPVRIECMGRVNSKQMYLHTTEEAIMRYHTWQNEEIQRRFLPAATQRTGNLQTQVTVVLDMTGARLGDLISSDARAHIKNFVQVTSDFYPEILYTMLIINAPRVLSMAWDFVAPLLDAGTKRKITIAPPGARSRSLIHAFIHPSQLPVFLGGELSTPLDRLLPIVDSGGGPGDFETLAGEWDGYWGLSTAEPAGVAALPTTIRGNGVSEVAEVALPSATAATVDAETSALVVELEQKLAELDRSPAAPTVAVSNRRTLEDQGKQQLELKMAGTEHIHALLNQADQLIADAQWLRAEKQLTEVLASGEFEQYHPEADDYGELHEILGSCAVAKGDYQAAVERYSEGLRHRPDGARLRLGRGRAYARLGKPAVSACLPVSACLCVSLSGCVRVCLCLVGCLSL